MTKFEFMEELENLLSDIPIEERNEAIQYYKDYFEDAGADHEEEILKELVSPARVAGIIKADLNANVSDHENRGYYTEKGYQDTVYVDEKFEIERAVKQKEKEGAAANDANQDSAGGAGSNGTGSTGTGSTGIGSTGAKNNNTRNTNVALIVLLCLLAIPVGIPIFFSFFGIFIGLAATIFSLFIAFGITGVVLIAVGFVLFVSGIVSLSIPLQGIVFCGAGLLVFGLGILFLLLSILLCGKVLPAMFRGIVNLFRLPFRNRSVMA